MGKRTIKKGVITRGLAAILSLALAVPLIVLAAPGGTTNNSGLIPFDQAFFAFEVENVLSTLKEEPIWDELEKMLDNPYAIQVDTTMERNFQGFPSYRSTLPRRRSFIFRDPAGQPCAPGSAGCVEVALPSHVVHPLNYNHMNGEELRLLNLEFTAVPWDVPNQLVLIEPLNTNPALGPLNVPRYEYNYLTVTVSAGAGRIDPEEAPIDFNSPSAPDNRNTCIVSPEVGLIDSNGLAVPEGSIICGGDPAEPGHAGFGVLAANLATAYSTPAVPGGTVNPDGTKNSIVGLQLFDPARGVIPPRNPLTGEGGLRKPSLSVPDALGSPGNPNYLVNSEANLAADPALLLPSNENDYARNRNLAAVLGKALFWDMQVGSDTVQSCGTCHFHAGVDNRTKNQLNPNHLGGDLTLQLKGANQSVAASDFPFHKLADREITVEATNCGLPGLPACPAGLISDVNDIMSSMGVIFGAFADIPAIGTFLPAANGVTPLPPDIRGSTIDPIPVFQGLRRVEPRNTPTFFAAPMNFDNFWDGRARHDFNGGSVFGASDPQAHVMVDDGGTLTATRQIIRFASVASLATGPALSNFEMSFDVRNWAKIGKKLLQAGVTPLANQLVDPTDSVLGPYSNQGGSACVTLPVGDRSGDGTTAIDKPGLCISYPALIRLSFYQPLWQNGSMHLDGCYTDGNAALHPNQCAPGSVSIPVFDPTTGTVINSSSDPFDNYVLSIAAGQANAADTNQFTQMEGNMPLFFGLSVHLWASMLMPDDTPMDRFYDANPDSFKSFGEANEPGLVLDLRNCQGENATGGVQPCFTEVGNFKRDPGVIAFQGRIVEGQAGTPVPSGGTRQAGSPDPLLGMDFFLGSNLSLKNPNFRSFRCGECHQGGTLTDHTVNTSNQLTFNDFAPEFVTPGVGAFPEPLGRNRVITGFALEGEINGNAQDAIERNIADFCAVEPCVDAYGNPIPGGVAGGFPQGQAFFDNGVYNLGIRPIAEDVGRGGPDAFGWPLSLGYLMLKNLGGPEYTPGGDNPANGFAQPPNGGIPLLTFDPAIDPVGGGVFGPTSQDQQINPGFEEEPLTPLLPPYLAPWASNNVVGDEVEQDEVFAGLNTLCAQPILEGFVDTFGPFNPAATVGETFNNAKQPAMSLWPNVNRVNTQGAFKAPTLRNVELTGPYFHTGSKLTLRQELDFYDRGGDFPKLNSAHRDFLLMNLDEEDEALGGVDIVTGQPLFTAAQKEEIKQAVIDFLLELTDERVKFERAPFDHPEVFVPLDGTAPDNGSLPGLVAAGRQGFLNNLANGMFLQSPAVGQGGNATPLTNFLGVSSIKGQGISHYDSITRPGGNISFDSGGVVDVADALRALRIAVGLIQPTAADFLNGDVAPFLNGSAAPDGQITIADALMILRRAVGLIVL